MDSAKFTKDLLCVGIVSLYLALTDARSNLGSLRKDRHPISNQKIPVIEKQ